MRLAGMAVLVAWLWVAPVRAGDFRLSFEFAMSLQSEGEFYRAITEFKRTLFLTRGMTDDVREQASFQIARTYLIGGEFQESAQELERFLLEYPEGDLRYRARLLLARARFELHQDEESLQTIDGTLTALPDASEWRPVRARLMEERFWLAAGTLDIPEARRRLEAVRELIPGDPRLAGLAQRLDQGTRLKRRSPALAGVLSAIVPGAGQMYAGRWADGIVALVVNGLFVWGTVAAIQKEMYGAAAAIGVVELGWYGGNIYGGVGAAHRYNRRQRESFLGGLREDFRLPPADL